MNQYYQTLGLKPNASYQEIRKRYRALVIKYHPDRNVHLRKKEYLETQEEFKKIAKAYSILSNSKERNKYDQESKFRSFASNDYQYSFTIPDEWYNVINMFFSQKNQPQENFTNLFQEFMSNNTKNDDGDTKENIFKAENIDKLLKSCKFFYQNFQDKFPPKTTRTSNQETRTSPIHCDNLNNNHQDNQSVSVSRKGKVPDIRIEASAKLSDIYVGKIKEIEVSRKILCLECNGNGYLGIGRNMSLCQLCRGLMFDHKKTKIQLNVAKPRTVCKGEGDQSPGKHPGDIVIKILAKKLEKFEIINDYDLELELDLEFDKFYFGGQITFSTPDDQLYQLEIEPSEKLRKNKRILVPKLGLLIEDTDRRGDIYLRLNVILPEYSIEDLAIFKPNFNQSKFENNIAKNVKGIVQ